MNNENIQGQLYVAGTRGYSAYEIAVQNGFVGTEEEWLASLKGEQGEQGIEGKSAYQVAVENGYEGTEEEWLSEFLTPEGYILKQDIVDNLESNSNQKVLSAKQGKELKQLVDNKYDKSFIDESLEELNESINSKASSTEVRTTYATKEDVEEDINSLSSQISGLASGSPLVASSTAGMTDTSRVYVNSTDGHWYYYDGTSWVDGGIYQSTGLDLDSTLTESSKAPKSKSVGDYIFQNRVNISSNQERLTNYDGIIKPVNLEIGRITYTQQGGFYWIHDNAGKKCVSTADNTEYHLYPSDIVSLIDYATYRFKIIYRDMNGSYHYSDWRTTDYIVPVEGYYIFSVGKIDDTAFDNAVEISKQFTIKTNNYEENLIRSMGMVADDYIKSKLVNGTVNTSSGLYQTQSNRATFYDFIKLNRSICICNIDRNFAVAAYTISNNTVTTLSYVRNNIIIPANTKFKILIRRNTEISGETVSVDELANSIKVYEESHEQVDNIFDERHLEPGYVNGSGGNEYYNNVTNCPVTSTIYYEIGDEKLISLQILNPDENDTDWYCIAYYDEEYNFLSRYSLYPNEKNIKHLISLTPTAKYFRLCYNHKFYNKIMMNYGFNFADYKHYPIEETNRKVIDFNDYGIFGVAHAGGGGGPENTLPAYKIAKQRGFKFAECDIQFTVDNIPVLMHDATVDRTTNGSGRVREMTLEEIKQLDASNNMQGFTGTPVPTFEELLVLCRDIKIIPKIELKMDDTTPSETPQMLRILYDIIKKYHMENRVCFVSSSYQKLLTMRDIDPYAVLWGMSFDKNAQLATINRTYGILKTPTNTVGFAMNKAYLDDSSFLNRCKELSLPVDIWTFYGENGMLEIDKYVVSLTSESQRPYEKVIYDANIDV